MAIFAHNSVGEQFRLSWLGRSLLVVRPEAIWKLDLGWMVKMASLACLVLSAFQQASPRFPMQQQKRPQRWERARLNVPSTPEVCPRVTFANTPLTQASQLAKPRVSEGSEYRAWIQRCESLRAITVTMYHTDD